MNQIHNTLQWFVKAGQMTDPPKRDARQTAFYIGMQLEEFAEKLTCVLQPNTALVQAMSIEATKFKNGEYTEAVAWSLRNKALDLLDGDMDLLWVTLGAAAAQGADVEGAYETVSEANWAKFPNGVVTRDPLSGKVRKPAGWVPPDLTPHLARPAQAPTPTPTQGAKA
jgi:predicted HAD superfamily Cof-like phosphohydrolase